MLSRTVRHTSRQIRSIMRPPRVQRLMFAAAGIAAESLRSSRTAVFSATFADDFTRIMAKDPDAAPLQAAMGTTPSILPNRISWYFNLRGPSIHIDTACSGGLVAMDLACQSIKTGNATAVCLTVLQSISYYLA
jgi:acyl transferase domain-containing protein